MHRYDGDPKDFGRSPEATGDTARRPIKERGKRPAWNPWYQNAGERPAQRNNHDNYFKRPTNSSPSPGPQDKYSVQPNNRYHNNHHSNHSPSPSSSSSFDWRPHAPTSPNQWRKHESAGPSDRYYRQPRSWNNQPKWWTNQSSKRPNAHAQKLRKNYTQYDQRTNGPFSSIGRHVELSTDANNRNLPVVSWSGNESETSSHDISNITPTHDDCDPAAVRHDIDNDSDMSVVSADLEKLYLMTAADFDRDRYARYGIHESEIKDYVRTITFKNCIEYCADRYIKDKVVLVIRCGIGLLPLLCVRNGYAKKVIALDQSACIEYARRIVKDNGYCDKITLIQSSVQELKKLPHGLTHVDVIISDFMGDCIISQGDQMEQVIIARDRYLTPNGIMIPKCVALYGQLSDQRRAYENRRMCKKPKMKKYKKSNFCAVEKRTDKSETEDTDYDTDSSTDSAWCSWWKDVYGFDMRSNANIILNGFSKNENTPDSNKGWCLMTEPLVTFFDPCRVVSNACLIIEFDMLKCTIADTRHVECKDLKLKCTTPYTSANGGDFAHMLELFMIVDFPNGQVSYKNKEPEEIGFSTSSFSPYTRYRQTGLLLRDQLIIEQGDELTINEFHMWRGPQVNQENKLLERTSGCENQSQISETEENLKLRLRYSFKNKHTRAIDRRCIYTLSKLLF